MIFDGKIEPTGHEKLIMKAVDWWKDRLSHNIKQETGDPIYNSFFDMISNRLNQEQVDKFGIDLANAISECKDDCYCLRTDWHPCGVLYDIAEKQKIKHSSFPLRMVMFINFQREQLLSDILMKLNGSKFNQTNISRNSHCGFSFISNIHS